MEIKPATGIAPRISNLRLIKRAMRQSKRRAMRIKGLSVNTDIAAYIIQDTLSFRGRNNDDAVWFALALRIAGNTREQSHEVDDDELQGVFDLDLPVPIKKFRLVASLDDGRTAVQRDNQWVVVGPDGKEESAKSENVPDYLRQATRQYDCTKIIEVRNFHVAEGDQRTRQMEESMERGKAAYERWVKGWSLIRPLLLAHPAWTLGDAVDDLRDRDEWPREFQGDDYQPWH